ncbi:MAG: hypothetical protein WA988_18970 [Candidatus Nanopelagicales bacterium]|mgnify:FL=1
MTKDDTAAKKSTSGPSFDRIKPANTNLPTTGPVVDAREDDVQGKRALFSGADQPPAIGSVALECSTCDRRSVVSYVRLLKMMTTGFFMPVPLVGQRAWVKCPACQHHAWVTVTRD